MEISKFKKQLRELDIAGAVFKTVGISVILILLGIFILLILKSLPFFQEVSPFDFLLGKNWRPTSSVQPTFGIFPFIISTLLVSFGAMAISIPLGIGAALFLSEMASFRMRETIKPIIELLASIPSVVIGFLGVTLVGPLLAALFGLSGNGLFALNGSILLSFMALPTIISISEDALHAVPQSYRNASYALGATRWETMTKVVLPASKSGVFAAIMLGMGRTIGETMAVLMACGNSLEMPFTGIFDLPGAFLKSVTTLTSTIAIELGEVASGSTHMQALFAVALVLFVITFFINILSDRVLQKQKRLLRGISKQKRRSK